MRGEKVPTVMVAHTLAPGSTVGRRHEVTDAEDVVFRQIQLPNYPYVALGAIRQPLELGRPSVWYSGSIERVDFGEIGEEKSVVVVEVGPGDHRSEPELIALHPTQLF